MKEEEDMVLSLRYHFTHQLRPFFGEKELTLSVHPNRFVFLLGTALVSGWATRLALDNECGGSELCHLQADNLYTGIPRGTVGSVPGRHNKASRNLFAPGGPCPQFV